MEGLGGGGARKTEKAKSREVVPTQPAFLPSPGESRGRGVRDVRCFNSSPCSGALKCQVKLPASGD